jgi:succinate-acetate transporter protein
MYGVHTLIICMMTRREQERMQFKFFFVVLLVNLLVCSAVLRRLPFRKLWRRHV